MLMCVLKSIENDPWWMLFFGAVIGTFISIYIQNKWEVFFKYLKASKHRKSNDLDSAATLLESSILSYKQSNRGFYRKSLRLLAFCLNNSNKNYSKIENIDRAVELYESLYSDLSKKWKDKDIYYIIDYCKALMKKSLMKEQLEVIKKQGKVLDSIEEKALNHIQLRSLYKYERGKYYLNLSRFENTEENVFLSTNILIDTLLDPSLILITRTGENDFEHNIKTDIATAYSILAEDLVGKSDDVDFNQIDEVLKKSMFYYEKALELSSIERYPKRMATVYTEMGILFHLKFAISNDKKDLQESVDRYEKCLAIIESVQNKEMYSKTKMNLAMTFRDSEDYTTSLKCCNEALEAIKFLEFPYLFSEIKVTQAKTYALIYENSKDESLKEKIKKLINEASLVINETTHPKYQRIIEEVLDYIDSERKINEI